MSILRKWRLDTAMLQPAELFVWAPRPQPKWTHVWWRLSSKWCGASVVRWRIVGDVVETPWNSLKLDWVPSQYCDGLRRG
eukprot:470777-Pyramimonas_sp.AAC.1